MLLELNIGFLGHSKDGQGGRRRDGAKIANKKT